MEHRDKLSENIKKEKKLLAMSYYIYARILVFDSLRKVLY